MTAINILLAVLGGGVTLMVVAGMVMLTPQGSEAHVETPAPPEEEPIRPVAATKTRIAA